MSRYLIDTNILARIVSPRDPLKPVAVAAVDSLRRRNESLSVTPQNLLEFWAVATRPREANGLGLTPEEAAREVDRFSQNFPLVTEPPKSTGTGVGSLKRMRYVGAKYTTRGSQRS